MGAGSNSRSHASEIHTTLALCPSCGFPGCCKDSRFIWACEAGRPMGVVTETPSSKLQGNWQSSGPEKILIWRTGQNVVPPSPDVPHRGPRTPVGFSLFP